MNQDNQTSEKQSLDNQKTISCAEFQDQLPELFISGTSGRTDDPILAHHLATCDNCSALVRDLQYIADQARMLLEPAQNDPSPDVWANISKKMDSERSEAALHPPVSN